MKKTITLLLLVFLNSMFAFAQCGDCESQSKCDKIRPKTETVAQSNAEDEFEAYDPAKEKAAASSSDADEFEAYNPNADTNSVAGDTQPVVAEKSITEHKLFFPILSLIMTALAGVFIRYEATRKLRGVFLIASAVVLGFYVGACPCPISSFSYAIIAMTGGKFIWENIVWFVALIPLTYIFHKTWCGWICHLGALQEFLYMPAAKIKFLRSRRTQLVMKYMRYALVLTLIVQVAITHSYMYDAIDPFKTAYNLGYNASYTEWILLALLLVSSIFIYRPFCKAACPIGLILGWVTKIKGAAVVGYEGNCTNCAICARTCNTQAIYRQDNQSTLENKECIACGECMDGCSKSALKIYRNSEKHNETIKMCKDSFRD